MGLREEAFFINGVFRGVMEETLLVPGRVPETSCFMKAWPPQSYSNGRI